MRIRSFSYFLLGVLVTTVATTAGLSLAGTTPSPVGLCADKKTAVVRLADKGRCKKTERLVAPFVGTESLTEFVTKADLATYAKKSEVAPSRVSATPIGTASLPASGTVTLKATEVEVTDRRVRTNAAELGLVELVSSSIRAVTRKYEVPAEWNGKIIGECPADAPIFTGAGYYAEVGGQSAMGESGFPSFGGYALGVRVNAQFGAGLGGSNPAMTLFVTQMCGSAVALSPPTTTAQ